MKFTLINPMYRYYEVHADCETCHSNTKTIGGFDVDDTSAKARLLARALYEINKICSCKDKQG